MVGKSLFYIVAYLTKILNYGLILIMSKKVFAFTSTLATYLFVAVSVYAVNGDELKDPANLGNVDPAAVPQLAVNMLFMVAAFLAVGYLMYGGIRWITSRGDKVAVESARKHIVAAIIGLVIVAGSFFILQTVFSILGTNNPLKGGFKLPQLSPQPT